MADRGGRPLDGISAQLADDAFATMVAGWWLATLGAKVSPGDTSADDADDGLPGVVRRFLSRELTTPGAGQGVEAPDLVLAGVDAYRSDQRRAAVIRHKLSTGNHVGDEQALWTECGLADLTRELVGHAGYGHPCVPANRQPSILTGTTMALLAMAAQVQRLLGGDPSPVATVDTRALLALLPMQPVARAQLAVPTTTAPAVGIPGGVFEASDGPVYARPVEPDHWRTLLDLIPDLPEPGDGGFLGWDPESVDHQLRDWMRQQARHPLVGGLQDRHVPMAAVRTVAELLDDPHLEARGFASPGPDPDIRPPWIVMSEGHGNPPPAVRESEARGPLSGVRVLDLTWAWAGPFATRLLDDLGAEVLNVEWYPRASNLRTQAPFAPGHDGSPNAGGWWSSNQRGKKSIGINLKHPEGRALVHAMAGTSHLTMENFAPGVVERLGVAFSDLVKVNPAMVYVSMSGWGRGGPSEHWIGYGTHIQAASGACQAMPGPSGGISQMMIPYADPVSGLCAAVGAVAYLYSALATGKSLHLDVSELECMALALMEPLLESASGSDPTRYPYEITEAKGGMRLRPYGSDPGHEGLSVQTMGDVLTDPRLSDYWIRDQSAELAGAGVRIARAPWVWDEQPGGTEIGAPDLFADTRSVLRTVIGLDDRDIDRLQQAGAVATADRQ